MLKLAWNNLSNVGVKDNLSLYEARYIILTNRYSMIAAAISSLMLLVLFIGTDMQFWTPARIITSSGVFIFLSTILCNKVGKYELAKWVMCWTPAILILSMSLLDKFLKPEYTVMKDFFSFRFLLVPSVIIPVLIFSTQNLKKLLLNLFPSFFALIFFNVIHDFLGLGINDFGYNEPYLNILDIIIAFSVFALIGFVLGQRFFSDKFELELREKQEKLREKNRELSHMNTFINEQNHEMNSQSEKLLEGHEALLEAHSTIEQQKKLLEEQNLNLETKVMEQTKDLSRVNEELVIRNNELRQFSHTLSHNLKSPVATFQGLLNLLDHNDLNEANKEIMKYLHESLEKMHDVFFDMNEMLEIRNKLYNSIEDVDLQLQIDSLHSHFYQELTMNKINFNYDFNGVKVLRTNEKQLNGILFHLISNAIKFRSVKRDPEINISIEPNGQYNYLTIRDNGEGIDMARYASKLFFPYQQFHSELSGKGLGLYLVKLHTESLGGVVELQSELDDYTEVTVKLKK